MLLRPAAQARIILARSARAWAVLGRRTHRSSVSLSVSSNSSGGIGLPIAMIIPLLSRFEMIERIPHCEHYYY